jgi:hypothetical protein
MYQRVLIDLFQESDAKRIEHCERAADHLPPKPVIICVHQRTSCLHLRSKPSFAMLPTGGCGSVTGDAQLGVGAQIQILTGFANHVVAARIKNRRGLPVGACPRAFGPTRGPAMTVGGAIALLGGPILHQFVI